VISKQKIFKMIKNLQVATILQVLIKFDSKNSLFRYDILLDGITY